MTPRATRCLILPQTVLMHFNIVSTENTLKQLIFIFQLIDHVHKHLPPIATRMQIPFYKYLKNHTQIEVWLAVFFLREKSPNQIYHES